MGTQYYKKKQRNQPKNKFLVPILDPRSSVSELFNAFSSLINISSIMIEIHGEVDQNSFSNIFKGSQISEVFKSS
jgi:hypothetical protein